MTKAAVGRLVTLVRAGYGLGLVCAPELLIRLAGGPATLTGDGSSPGAVSAQQEAGDARARRVARVLGVRHLVQAALTAAAEQTDPGSPVALGGGAVVDLLHAASMLALGAADGRVRRTALADAALETALAAAGAWGATARDYAVHSPKYMAKSTA